MELGPIKKICCIRSIRIIALALVFAPVWPAPVFASSTQGTILPAHTYAWGENIGWINFAASSSNVTVTDSGLTGFIWSQSYGWINLAPTTTVGAFVANDGHGNLSGYAWGQNTGWISFQGAVINNSGKFTGTIGTASTTMGRITFDCTSCDVETDWRPQSGGGGTTTTPTGPVVSVAAGVPQWTPPASVATPTSSPSSTTATTTNLSSSTQDLQALLQSLEAQLAALEAQAVAQGSATPSYSFTRNLSYGMTGSDVKALQQYLIAQNKGPAAERLKAHGVTQNFATLTVGALIEFQRAVGITPASGYFGPITRAWVKAH